MRSKSTLAGLLPSRPVKTLPLSSQWMSSHRERRSLGRGRAGRRSALRLLVSPARPPLSRTITADTATAHPKLTRDRVALGDDPSSFVCANWAALEISDDITFLLAPAGNDARYQRCCDVAQGRV